MRTHLFMITGLTAWLCCAPAVASAQPAASFSELAASGTLKVGQRVDVRNTAGGETRGVFAGFRDGDLVLFVGKQRSEARFGEPDVRRIRRAGGNAMVWGTAIGATTAAVITAAGAASYGENEGGEFCGGCFIQWGALSIPAGAGIGAAIGLLIDQVRRTTLFSAPSRPSLVAAPVFVHGGAGLLVSARF
jgi:hypothetical protein